MREKIEVLEDHPHLHPNPVDVVGRVLDVHAIHDDLPGVDFLEPVDGAQQRAFPRSARPDNDHLLARIHGQRDVVQRLQGAEKLAHLKNLDDRFRTFHRS